MNPTRRLYDQFRPEHYALNFDLTNYNGKHGFAATTVITGEKVHSSEPLRLHARDLEVTNINIDGEIIHDFYQEDDELVIPSTREGKIVVFIAARGIATDAMHGIYPCYYELGGKKCELFATQFESHHAREAFPCIDEPEAKATFAVTIVAPAGKTVLSNMPPEDIDPFVDENGWVHTSFKTTPRMSSYLLAFVVGDLQKHSAKTWRGVEVNVYATPVYPEKNLKYACNWAKRSIEFFEDYFDTHYPLPKCDQVALPDFSASAMENWGLVTYRESALLIDPKHATTETKQQVSSVISHEISHQWFGNLVTMKWWDNLWLNESFANLMEYVACDALEPNWDIWDEFSATESLLALRRDALDGVQSVKMEVHDPGEIEALFDHAIVYAKGSRLVRMLREYVGDGAFRQGLHAYFQQFAYSNTTENDLWNALSMASGKDVASFINIWLTHPGYPLISFGDGALSQTRFFIGEHSEDPTVWPVPLLPSSPTFPRLLEIASIPVANDTVLLNMTDGVHFVTYYTDSQFKTILQTLSNNSLTSVDSLRLLNEQSLLAIGGVVDANRLLDLLKAIEKNQSPGVWKAALNILQLLRLLVENDSNMTHVLKISAHNLAAAQHIRLGWKQQLKEPELNTRLRPYVLEFIGYAAPPEVISFAKAAFSNGFDSMTPSTRVAVARIVIQSGIDDSEFRDLLELYHTTASPEIRLDLIDTLSSTRAPEQIQMLLQCLTDGTVRPQDIRRWLPKLLTAELSRDKTWDWIRSEWDWIVKTFKGDMTFDSFPMYAGRYLASRQQLDEFREFFKPWRFETALKRAIELGEKELEATVLFVEKNQPILAAILQKEIPSATL